LQIYSKDALPIVKPQAHQALGQVVNNNVKQDFRTFSIVSMILRKMNIYWKKIHYCQNGIGTTI
jgi:hypothetical protein